MGALEEAHFMPELEENDVELGFEPEPEPEPESESDVAVRSAVRVLLEGLGEDYEREGLKKTPLRVAKAFKEGTRGYSQKVKDIVKGSLFPESRGSGGLVIVRDFDLFSHCESCLLPFSINCHISYVPSFNQVLGLSKLSRISDIFAKRLQNPNRLAKDICCALEKSINPAGIGVFVECYHVPLPENLNSDWIRVSSCAKSGVFESEGNSLWNDFFALLKLKGVGTENERTGTSTCTCTDWCPMLKANPLNGKVLSKPYNSMLQAVATIIHSFIGEDPVRKELTGTPYRYVQWLMKFKSTASPYPNFKLNSNLHLNSEKVKNGEIMNGFRPEIHMELGLGFCSQCEHHLLPFYGVVHIGYFENGERESIDRAELQSMVHHYACNLQVQERLTRQIAESVYSNFKIGVIVVVEASHICMISRGIEKVRSSTATISVLGKFSTDPDAKSLFLQSISDAKI